MKALALTIILIITHSAAGALGYLYAGQETATETLRLSVGHAVSCGTELIDCQSRLRSCNEISNCTPEHCIEFNPRLCKIPGRAHKQ